MTRRQLMGAALVRTVLGFGLLGACFFTSAGTLRYWPAWIYLGVLFVPMMIALAVLVRRDPALLERRLKMKEKERGQSRIIKAATVIFLTALVIPGLDYRFGWSAMSMGVVIAANAVVVASYLLFFRVLMENSYAARTIEVSEDQEVISTGPYAIVRHPMYTAVFIMYTATPLALGSYWGLIPFLGLPAILTLRIFGEEETLRRELPGYAEYCERVRWRLLPGIW